MPSHNATDLAFTSALEQAKLIKERQITPLELTQIYFSLLFQVSA